MPRRKASLGVLPPGTRVLGIKIPPPEADGPRPEGAIICQGVIPGRAVPWCAPLSSRDGGTVPTRRYRKYKAWQETVAFHARQLMGRRRPYGGHVRLDCTFHVRAGGNPPDRSNALKAFEDAMQSIVYINDRQVKCGWTELVCSMDQKQCVEFKVIAL